MFHHFDEDEWEIVIPPYDPAQPLSRLMQSVGRRRREPAEVAQIKAERRAKEDQAIMQRAWCLVQAGIKPRIRIKAGSAPCQTGRG